MKVQLFVLLVCEIFTSLNLFIFVIWQSNYFSCIFGISGGPLGLLLDTNQVLFMVFSYLTTNLVFEVQLSSFCEIENVAYFLRITDGVSVWMIWMLNLIGKHWFQRSHTSFSMRLPSISTSVFLYLCIRYHHLKGLLTHQKYYFLSVIFKSSLDVKYLIIQ